MTDLTCKLLIIGGGPGGYVCGIRAGQLGLETIVVEEKRPGGTCLNVGCIPSKALIHAADEFHKLTGFSKDSVMGIRAEAPRIDMHETLAWKDGIVNRLNTGVAGLLKKAGVRLLQGHADFVDGKTVRVELDGSFQTISAQHVVIATGSEPVELPHLPFGGDVISSTEALALTEIPQRLAIVGAGYIGLEIGTAFAKLGAQVTIIEAADTILPQYDTLLTRPVRKRLDGLGVTIMTGCKAMGFKENALEVERPDGGMHSVPADKVLVTVGRRPRRDHAAISGLDLTMRGQAINIDDQCRTSMREVFAIGDITGEPMLAHRAMAQGEMVAEIVAGHPRRWDKMCIPAVCFTDPEIVTCGMSAREAKAQGIEIVSGRFPFSANGRAMTMQAEEGLINVITRKDNGLILGIEAVGAGISELSAAFAIAMEMGARADDVAAVIHAHPTQSEALQEACLAALGHPLHI